MGASRRRLRGPLPGARRARRGRCALTLLRADARFLLPRPPRTAVTFGDVGAWAQGLEEAGIAVVAAGSPADLAVAHASLAHAAVGSGATMLILEGRGGASKPRANGYATSRFLARPRPEDARLFIPLDGNRAAAADAVEHWAAAYTRAKQARNMLARALLRSGLFPELSSTVTVAAKEPGLPFLVEAARSLGIEPDGDWLLTIDRRDPLSRSVFHLIPRGAAAPEWALKFARVRGYDGPFRRDEEGLSLARGAASAERHAPRLVGRFQVEGLHASLETAAVGPKLRSILVSPGSEREKLALIDEVAEWLVDVACETVTAPETLGRARARLAERLARHSTEHGVSVDIVDRLATVPGVLQHRDMGCDHVVVDRGRHTFTVVDWESARRPWLPVWDLLQFLTDALTLLDGSQRVEQVMRLFRGEHARSPILFRWLRVAVDALRIPEESVGIIATLVWLEAGLGKEKRVRDVERIASGIGPGRWLAGELGPHWLRDPALGPNWSCWSDG